MVALLLGSLANGSWRNAPFHLLKVDIESVETGSPEPAQVSNPSVRIIEWGCVQAAGSPLGRACMRDQAGVFEHLQVTRDCGKTDSKRLGKLGDRCIASPQPLQDRSANGIGQG
jgi:hypothetical protein